MGEESSAYWGEVAEQWAATGRQRLWRRHSDAVNQQFLRFHLPTQPARWLLKTDAFDETVSEGVVGTLAQSAEQIVACDVAPYTLHAAKSAHAALEVVAADVRHLPFVSDKFDVVVSLSTLDHFQSLHELEAGLRELQRVSRPGGLLLLTIDNGANPVVALRNALPAGWRAKSGLVPYHVGATCGPHALVQMLDRSGFDVKRVGAIQHAPRIAAIAAAWAVQRFAPQPVETLLLRALRVCERLARLPSRFLTGYFISVVAARRPTHPVHTLVNDPPPPKQ